MKLKQPIDTDENDRRVWHHKPHILMITVAAMPISLVSWSTLINNFAVEQATFTGREIGILQSLRKCGFLSFWWFICLYSFVSSDYHLLRWACLVLEPP